MLSKEILDNKKKKCYPRTVWITKKLAFLIRKLENTINTYIYFIKQIKKAHFFVIQEGFG